MTYLKHFTVNIFLLPHVELFVCLKVIDEGGLNLSAISYFIKRNLTKLYQQLINQHCAGKGWRKKYITHALPGINSLVPKYVITYSTGINNKQLTKMGYLTWVFTAGFNEYLKQLTSFKILFLLC